MLETIEEALISKQNNDTINDLEQNILDIIKQNPKITIKELCEKTGKSSRTVTRAISSLKDKKYIARIGANKNGYWEILR